MPTREDSEGAREARTRHPEEASAGGAREAESITQPEARLPQDTAARPESFAARLSAGRWSVVAGLCLLGAAACLLTRRMDAAFVVATLGVVAWFWNERNRLRPRGIEADERFRDEDGGFEDRDEE